MPLDERKALVAELFEIITGRVRDFVFKHDSVRVIQCALKYANQQQRKQIVTELRADVRPLAESKYGKFMVAKMVVEGYVSFSKPFLLSYPFRFPFFHISHHSVQYTISISSTNTNTTLNSDAEIRNMIVPEFYGHVRRLINHPEAAWIIDDIYRQVATTHQKALMLREWYGAEFALYGKTKAATASPDQNVSADLAQLLQESPEKRKTIMQYLHQIINQLVQKKMTGFTMLHDAMLQYFLNTAPGSSEANEFLDLLKSDLDEENGGDLLKNLAFTKSGSKVVSLALAYGTAKDRKLILRVYKDTVEPMAFDQNAHMVLLAAMDVIDDTKMTAKALFPELAGESIKDDAEREDRLLGLITHLTARIPILYPLAGQAKWLLSEDEKSLLSEIHAVRETTSKKDPETRRQELVQYLSPFLLPVVEHQAALLATNSFGCQFINEVLLECQGDKAAAVKAVAEVASGDLSSDEHAVNNAAAGKMLRALVSGGKFDNDTKKVTLVEPRLGFGNVLYDQLKGKLIDWAVSPSSFVVVSLLESEDVDEDKKKAVRAELTKGKKALEKAASGEGQAKTKTKEPAEGEKAVKNKKKKVEGPKGNAGAKILLSKL